MNPKKIAYCGLLTTTALLLSYVERMLAIPMLVPGMKLGLANVAVLIALYLLDNKAAFCIMSFFKNHFSVIAVSISGGISHNIGQIIIACIVVENIGLFYYLPFLVILGIVTGFLTGIVANRTIYYLNH